MQPNIRNSTKLATEAFEQFAGIVQHIKSESVVNQLSGNLATITRPLCYDCSSTDVSCADCGFDFEECECNPVDKERFGSGGYICKICMGVAIDETEYLDNVQAKCPACDDTLNESNIATWPKFLAGSLCDDCYVATSMGLMDKAPSTNNGEIIVIQDDGPCACGRLHLCDNCGIYRVSTKDKWQVIENIDLEFKAECTCTPEKKCSCEPCGVFRKNPSDPWIKVSVNGDKKESTTSTTSKTSYTSGGTTSTTSWGKCRHYGEPLKFTDGTTVYASSSNSKRPVAEQPDFGLYLDWVWKPTWRAEFIDWADYGTPSNFDAAYEAIVEAWERAKSGKKVEVGCIGGHGRTGTVLACMGVLSGQTPADAINYVRSTYCKETLETAGQEWFVRWFNAEWNELEFNEEEPQSWYGGWDDYGYGYDSYSGVSKSTSTSSSSSASGSYGGSHSQAQHFNTWVQGKRCDSDKCRHWDADIRSFSGGKSITQHTVDKCEVPMNAWTAEAYRIVTEKAQDGKLKLNIVQNLPPATIVVKGYRVPKPVATDKQHNPALDDCACDVCRYIALGGSQLFDTSEATTLVHENDSDAKVIKMYVHGGEIIDVPIADSFEPKPPVGTAKIGKRKGEYIMTDQGWVWDQLGLADAP